MGIRNVLKSKDSQPKKLLEGMNMDNIRDDMVDAFIHVQNKEDKVSKQKRGLAFEELLRYIFELGGYEISDNFSDNNRQDGGIDFFAEKDGVILGIQAKKRELYTTTIFKSEDIQKFKGQIDNFREEYGKKLRNLVPWDKDHQNISNLVLSLNNTN